MSDLLNTTAKKSQNSDSTFKVSPSQARGFGVQQKAEESAPATKAQLWENYQQAKQLSQKGANASAPALPIQAKLTIGEPGDKYEQEADSMAAQVMQMPEPGLANSNTTNSVQTRSIQPIQRACTECQEEKKEESKPEEDGDQIQAKEEYGQTPELTSIQRKVNSAEDPESNSNLESQLNGSKGGGSPLPDEVRGFMEPRFGSDFSGVRVHTGSDAVQMNGALNAQAFAHGSDIYFGAGKSPGNNELTAHELTHVVQQTGQIQSQAAPGAPAPANGTTNFTPNNTTREVHGATLSQVYDSMTNSGTHEAASVQPALKPQPQYELDAKGEKVIKAVVTVIETKEMPSWAELGQQCPPIKNEWNRFYGALDKHEDKHVEIDRKHFTDVHKKLVGKPQEAAWKKMDDVIEAADLENQAYDTRTKHGLNEGTIINSAVQCGIEKVSTEPGDAGLTSDTAVPESTEPEMMAKRRGLTDIIQPSQNIIPNSSKLNQVVQQYSGVDIGDIEVLTSSTGWIQRDPNLDSSVPSATLQTHSWPTTGETAKFLGIVLTENPDQLEEAMFKLVTVGLPPNIKFGIEAPRQFLNMILISTPPMSSCEEPKDPSYEECHSRKILKTKIAPLLAKTVQNLREKHQKFLDDFTNQAKDNTRKTLDANEIETKKEAIRYGITEQQIEHITSLPGGVSDNLPADGGGGGAGSSYIETKYDMDKESPAGKGLQVAAKVLLDRRSEITQLQSEQQSHIKMQRDEFDPEHKGMVAVPDDAYSAVSQKLEEKKKAYNDLREHLAGKFPVLDKFSDLNQDTNELQELVMKGPGSEMANLIAKKLADTIGKIATSRKGLDDGQVNVWRLPKMVAITQAQLGLSADPVKMNLVESHVIDEQPGMLEGVALMVLNLAALALAGPTGGLSLVAAAGVNAVVAAEHVQEYIVQDALTGSSLQKANALSQDEPSFVWLAVEIVGVAFDVGTVAAMTMKAFKTLAPLVKAAKIAQEGEELEKSLQAVRNSAQEAKVGEKAESIISKVKELRKGEDVSLKAAGATEKEVEALKTVAKAGEIEAAGEVIGDAVKAGDGTVKLTKNGHLYGCNSPCEILREKFAQTLAENENLAKELLELENRAKTASIEVLTGSEQGKRLAEQVKQDAAVLTNKLRAVDKSSIARSTEVTIKGSSDVAHELPQAKRFGQLEGGGEFEFLGNSSEGIEGYFTPKGSTNKIPVSFKNMPDVQSIKNAFREIRQNVPHVIKSGAKDSVLFTSLPKYKAEDVLKFVADSKPNVLPAAGVFKKVVIDCADGVVTINAAGIASKL
jgi:predicted secreted Zn-dependent protease